MVTGEALTLMRVSRCDSWRRQARLRGAFCNACSWITSCALAFSEAARWSPRSRAPASRVTDASWLLHKKKKDDS